MPAAPRLPANTRGAAFVRRRVFRGPMLRRGWLEEVSGDRC
jgi:hypothetical protein